jgi:hypothetical protein
MMLEHLRHTHIELLLLPVCGRGRRVERASERGRETWHGILDENHPLLRAHVGLSAVVQFHSSHSAHFFSLSSLLLFLLRFRAVRSGRVGTVAGHAQLRARQRAAIPLHLPFDVAFSTQSKTCSRKNFD